MRYACGGDWIELTGGELGHLAATVREAKLPDGCQVVLVNFMTPFRKTIHISLSPSMAANTLNTILDEKR